MISHLDTGELLLKSYNQTPKRLCIWLYKLESWTIVFTLHCHVQRLKKEFPRLQFGVSGRISFRMALKRAGRFLGNHTTLLMQHAGTYYNVAEALDFSPAGYIYSAQQGWLACH
jgi:hypothetical protein